MTIRLHGIPILETDRLVLRGPKAADTDGYVDFMMSKRSQYVGGHLSRAKSWRAFTNEIGHWLIRGFGMWAVTMKGDDTCLGYVGPWRPEGWPENEIGWVIWEDAEGKGVAQEAARAARDFAYGTLGWTTAVSYIDRPNHRSIALAERLGCVRDRGAATPEGDDCLVYRHPGPEDLQ